MAVDSLVRQAGIPIANGSNRISLLSPRPTAAAVIAQDSGAVTDTQQVTVPIPAGGTIRVNLAGISFYFSSMSSVSGVQARPINSGQTRSFITYALGQGLRLGTSGFQQVELVNLDPINQNTVTIVVGGGIPNNSYDEFIDKRVIVVNNPASNVFVEWGTTISVAFKTRTPAWADSLLAGATQVVASGYLGKNRKQIVFANDDLNQVLTVFDSTNNIMGSVQPSTSWTIESTDTMALHNPGANPVTCHIGEVYYNI